MGNQGNFWLSKLGGQSYGKNLCVEKSWERRWSIFTKYVLFASLLPDLIRSGFSRMYLSGAVGAWWSLQRGLYTMIGNQVKIPICKIRIGTIENMIMVKCLLDPYGATRCLSSLTWYSLLQERDPVPCAFVLVLLLAKEVTAWMQCWDTDDGALEPEEPDSDEEEAITEDQSKKKRRLAPPVPDDGYPKHLWQHGFSQGRPGFNAHAREVLSSMQWVSPSQGDVPLLPQQEVVASLVHPASPIRRLLCDHNTGSGKTLCMVRIADNFYHDPRPKVLVFPKESVATNFLSALWEWPSRWRDFVCHQNPAAAMLASNKDDWWQVRHERWSLGRSQAMSQRARAENLSLQQAIKEFCVNPMRATLEMKRAFIRGKASAAWFDHYWSQENPHEIHPPQAPLRAYRFTSAGGRAAELVGGMPRGCVFKAGRFNLAQPAAFIDLQDH